jgi:hypothetical protein
VVSRGVPVDKLELASIADLRPYLRGRWSMGAGLALGELRQRRHRPSPPRIPTVPEVAHLTLIESSVADSERIRTDLTAGRRPRARREAGSARAARWEAAVRAQMSARHQGRRDANDAVTAMVNHMTHLAEKAAWFRESPELRQAAIDETIRFTAHDEAVRSLAAQQAWLKSWSDRRSTSSLLDEHPATDPDGPVAAEWAEKMRARIAAHEEAERHWLAAWAAWAEAPTKDADQS